MRRLLAVIGVAVAAAFLVALAPQAQAKDAKYVGAEACSRCHKKDKEGRQFEIWQGTKHAKAFETLGTAEAKSAAASVGVSGEPQKSEACLVCHTTGFGQPESAFERKFAVEDGVQCEACHGAGSEYKSRKTMKEIREETGPDMKKKSPTAEKTGMVIPNESTCKRCHSEQIEFKGKTYKNPKYKEFNFKTFYDKIKHPIPS
jgi:Cytochrome c554 and c-prime